MGWLLELLFGAVREMCVQFIVDMMDLSSSMFTELLSCDLDLFEELFGVVGDLYKNVMLPVGIMLLLMILIWQLFKGMFGKMGAASEDPIELIFRSAACLLFIVYSRDVVNYILNLAGTPYQWVTGTSIPVSSFSSYVSVAEGLVSAIGVDSMSISLLLLILQFVVAWNYFKMMFILAERYVLLGVFSYTAPLAFAAGGSKATNGILASWVKMFGGQVLIVILDAWCMKMFLSAYGNLSASTYGFTKFFAATMCLIGFCKITAKLDSYMGSLGVNLGRISGGMGGMGALLMAGRLMRMGGGFGRGAVGGTAAGSGPRPGTGGGPGPAPMNFGSGKAIPLGNMPESGSDGMFGENDLSAETAFGKEGMRPDSSLGMEDLGHENSRSPFAPLDGNPVSAEQGWTPFGESQENPMETVGAESSLEPLKGNEHSEEFSGTLMGEDGENTLDPLRDSGAVTADESGTIPLSGETQPGLWDMDTDGIAALNDTETVTGNAGAGNDLGVTAPVGLGGNTVDSSLLDTGAMNPAGNGYESGMPAGPDGARLGTCDAGGISRAESAGKQHQSIQTGNQSQISTSGNILEHDAAGISRGGSEPQFAELGKSYGPAQPFGDSSSGFHTNAGKEAAGGNSYPFERDGKRYMRYDAGHYEKPQGSYQTIHENGKTYYELPAERKGPNLLPETRATLQKDGTLRLEKVYQPGNGRNQDSVPKTPVQEIPQQKREERDSPKMEKKPGKVGKRRNNPRKKGI